MLRIHWNMRLKKRMYRRINLKNFMKCSFGQGMRFRRTFGVQQLQVTVVHGWVDVQRISVLVFVVLLAQRAVPSSTTGTLFLSLGKAEALR